MTKYYIRDNGRIYGPATGQKIKLFVSKGFFSYKCEVSTDRQEWIEAVKLPELNIKPVIVVSKKTALPERSDNAENQPVTNYGQAMENNVKPRHRIWVKILIGILILLVLGAFAGVGYFGWQYLHKNKRQTSAEVNSFEQVCKKYGNCVGLVTVVLENKKGELIKDIEFGDIKISSTIPIGTAFAISENQFATNSHVAYSLKGNKELFINKVLECIIIAAALEQNIKTKSELDKFIANHKEAIDKIRRELKEDVRVRSVEIRLSHSNGERLTVSQLQVHPDYRGNVSAAEEHRNAEFDIAILHVSGTCDNFFPLAGKDALYELSPGQEIAYLGFPMEGLRDNGSLDVKKPEAIFKPGTIGKITDFNNVVSSQENNKSIIHDIPAAGGASGSPIFVKNGEVVAILWGVSHNVINGKRQASAVLHNKALRIDALDAVKDSRIYSWQEWIGE